MIYKSSIIGKRGKSSNAGKNSITLVRAVMLVMEVRAAMRSKSSNADI